LAFRHDAWGTQIFLQEDQKGRRPEWGAALFARQRRATNAPEQLSTKQRKRRFSSAPNLLASALLTFL
jgi:hypothetical protein